MSVGDAVESVGSVQGVRGSEENVVPVCHQLSSWGPPTESFYHCG